MKWCNRVKTCTSTSWRFRLQVKWTQILCSMRKKIDWLEKEWKGKERPEIVRNTKGRDQRTEKPFCVFKSKCPEIISHYMLLCFASNILPKWPVVSFWKETCSTRVQRWMYLGSTMKWRKSILCGIRLKNCHSTILLLCVQNVWVYAKVTVSVTVPPGVINLYHPPQTQSHTLSLAASVSGDVGHQYSY